jgi:hypothetical protein
MEKIHVFLVLEILGRPKEHVKEALNTLVVRMGSEKGVKIINKTYHDPVPVEGSKELFTAFAEVGLELESLSEYLGIVFAYMPSNIEVVKPEKLVLTKSDLNQLANTLTQRLHNYDAITKQTIAERDAVIKKLYEYAPHLFNVPNQAQNTAQMQANSEQKKEKKKTKKK